MARNPTERELKITAALYSRRPGVVDHVKETGHLPESIPHGGASIAMRHFIEERGSDPILTAVEQLVYEAILRDGRLPGGSVVLVDEHRDEIDVVGGVED